MDARKAGVYLIRNLHTGDVYVGSSSRSIAKRWREHRSCLSRGRHENQHLQRAWNKYGADMFAWEVIEHAEGRDAVLACEQRWIGHYWGGRMGVDCYNVLPTAGSTAGYIASPETRAKLRARTASPETRARLSAAGRGRTATPETRAKLRVAGLAQSPETLAKIGAAGRGRVKSPETLAKMRAASLGRVKSPEALAKMSAAARGRIASPEARAKMSAASRGCVKSPETRAKISASLRERQRKLRGKATYHQASLFDLAE